MAQGEEGTATTWDLVPLRMEPKRGHITVLVTEEPEAEGERTAETVMTADDKDGCKIAITYNRNVEAPSVLELLSLWATHYRRIHACAYTSITATPVPTLGADDMLYVVTFHD